MSKKTKTITIIFTWNKKEVKVPAHIYETFKNVDAERLLETRKKR